MPIIGNPIYQSAFVVDQFSGNGSTVAFTMSVAPAGVTNVLVAVSGVLQDPSTYGVVGNTITFSAAPPSGTGNISCRYLGVPVTGVTTTAYRTVTEFTATASQTTFTPPSYTVGFINVYLNGVLLGSADYTASNGTTVVLATGASAGNLVTVESFQVSSVLNAIPNTAGAINLAGSLISGVLPTTNGGSGTGGSSTTTVNFLVVGGGGGGGGGDAVDYGAGGGGAGGVRSSIASTGGGGSVESALTVTPGTQYTVTVGQGGVGGKLGTSNNTSDGTAGGSSTFSTITSAGGGYGAKSRNTNATAGGSGGSGGGAGGRGSSASGGSGTSGQGYAGGNFASGQNNCGGGGGGAGAVGVAAGTLGSGIGGNGGVGVSNTISGATVFYGGGGGGAGRGGAGEVGGTGGNGGGGNGSFGYLGDGTLSVGTAGTANTGGGGGAGAGQWPGLSGGSGVVIISYPATNKAASTTGPVYVSLAGGNQIYTFTGSGTITF